MKKVLAILLLLCIALPVGSLTHRANGTFGGLYLPPTSIYGNFTIPYIFIDSPMPAYFHIYANTTVILDLSVVTLVPIVLDSLHYTLDNNSTKVFITNSYGGPSYDPQKNCFTTDSYTYVAQTPIDNLQDGNHTVTVGLQDSSGNTMTASREFKVDTQYDAPKINILSPLNQTYNTSELPLIIASNGKLLRYDADLDHRSDAFRIDPDNETIKGLSNGVHKIEVYAWFDGYYTDQQTVYFSVDSQNPTNSMPTIIPTSPIPRVFNGTFNPPFSLPPSSLPSNNSFPISKADTLQEFEETNLPLIITGIIIAIIALSTLGLILKRKYSKLQANK